MPRVPLQALIWSPDRNLYELYTHDQLAQRFRPGDEEQWLTWLAVQTSVAFHGRSGRLNLHNEARTRGARYWYAYHSTSQRTRKRYLGKTANVTLARLEQVARDLTSEQSPAPPASVQPLRETLRQPHGASPHASRKVEQRVVLLSTKLSHPRLPAALVVRERLLRQLDAALAHRLTLLSASAGWGKTTLLSAWIASRSDELRVMSDELSHAEQTQNSRLITQNYQVAWVSLDALDNDRTRFWASVIAALRTRVPAVGAVALAMLYSPEPPPLSTILTTLLNDLAGVAAPIVLILDDYHAIDDPAIHEALTFLLEHLPAHLHLVLSSRVDPELPLSRWRVREQLAEIRAADLRFTAAEATTFFTQALGAVLAEEDVRRLERRTEGWIAGLQLAALAMRQRADRSAFVQMFTGSHRYLLDYVQEEILQRQPLPVQRFLLQTAVLLRMKAAVCAALTENPTSQAMLEWLERNNLFVVPLDEQRQWYRVHDLFREALLARLHATEPELVPRLHQRAAQWYAAQDELREAITHALAAADFAYAATLMEREASKLWLSGEAQTVHTWIQALPDAVLWQHARLALDAALRLLESIHATARASYTRTQAQVEQTIARVEALLRSQEATAWPEAEETLPALTDAEVALIQRRIRLLRALIASREILTRGDGARMRLLVQEIGALSEDEEMRWKMISLSITYWLTESLQREGALLLPKLLEAKQRVIQAGDHLATIGVQRWLASAYLRAGQLHLVQRECLEALALVERVSGRSAMAGYLHYWLVWTYYAWNRLEEASCSVQQMLHIAHLWQQVDLLVVGYQFLAQIELSTGDLAAADQALQKAEELVQQERFATHAFWMVAARVQWWLATGDLDAASNWAEHVVFSPETWDPNHKGAFLMLVRVYLAQQHYTQALAVLSRFSAYLDRPGDIDTTIEFLALQVVALHHGGKCEQARAVAARLLALTEPEGYIRVYLDAGEPMQQVLQSLLGKERDQDTTPATVSVAFVAKLLAAFPRTESPGLRTEYQIPEHSVLSPQSSALVEPLTRREQEVLRLLVAGASNQEIATQLVISLATVKKHVSNLLSKLGVESRTQAIARARDWSILA